MDTIKELQAQLELATKDLKHQWRQLQVTQDEINRIVRAMVQTPIEPEEDPANMVATDDTLSKFVPADPITAPD